MLNPTPFFIHSLTALSAILAKAEDWQTAKTLKPEVIPNLRLTADMLPFWRQIAIACDHAKGAGARLAGVDVPVYADAECTLTDLRARVAMTLEFLQSLPADAFDGADALTITVKAGPRELSFPAAQYLHGYAVPNFYFHMTTAYAILRSNGLEIGKRDFLGG
ncbi:DUF1993 domain-containing protein [Pararhodobacter zhoushanensis]|uniref:DUF1993 domain-containing protein n=1 Tax=Pararhodobacter zhoushanensis TaxID=2479545 RepID=UPI000F8E1F75|nr:DUF1993 domain-containing protein [Pararhodobacter zhoushanensis]